MLAASGLTTTFQANIWPNKDSISNSRQPVEPAEPAATLKPAIPYWTGIRVTRALRAGFVQACGQRIGLSEWRHMSKAINRRFLRSAEAAFNSIGLGLIPAPRTQTAALTPPRGRKTAGPAAAVRSVVIIITIEGRRLVRGPLGPIIACGTSKPATRALRPIRSMVGL